MAHMHQWPRIRLPSATHKHSALPLVWLMFAHMHHLYHSFHAVCTLKYVQLRERSAGLKQSIMPTEKQGTKDSTVSLSKQSPPCMVLCADA